MLWKVRREAAQTVSSLTTGKDQHKKRKKAGCGVLGMCQPLSHESTSVLVSPYDGSPWEELPWEVSSPPGDVSCSGLSGA